MPIHQKKYFLHLVNNLNKLRDSSYIIIACVWTVIILYLSLISATTVSKFNIWDVVGIDKLGHLLFYAMFAFLWCMGLSRGKTREKNILFFSISFGVFVEICQLYLFNGRSFELFDILANILGSVIGVILFKNLIN